LANHLPASDSLCSNELEEPRELRSLNSQFKNFLSLIQKMLVFSKRKSDLSISVQKSGGSGASICGVAVVGPDIGPIH